MLRIAVGCIMLAFFFLVQHERVSVAGERPTKSSDVVTISVSSEKPDADGKQKISITLTIAPTYHIYANPVENEILTSVQTIVRVTSEQELREAKVTYPAGKMIKVGNVETFRIYEGKVAFNANIVRNKQDSSPLEIVAMVHATNEKRNLRPSLLKAKVP